jgi:ABC-type sugar transport system ATPase subunit
MPVALSHTAEQPPDQAARRPLVRLREISKAYGGSLVLTNVNLDLFPGEVHALLGENGAGKSTLMKILFGVVQPTGGSIEIDGLGKTVVSDPRHALSLGIGLVSQELSLVPQLEVAQNVFLGQANVASLVERRRIRAAAARILEPIGPGIDVAAPVASLNMAERQVVEIARTLARGGRVIAFDEPTSSLTAAERDGLFDIIRNLRKEGRAIVYISHRMPEIGAIADRVTVLRDGKIVASGAIGDFNPSRLNELVVGRKLNEEFSRGAGAANIAGKETLRLEGLSTRAIHDVSLSLRAGEIFGLSGLVGSGRTELAQAIFGVDPITEGRMFIDGEAVTITSAADAIRAGIALIPEDRRREALVLQMDVQSNFGLGNERFFSRLGILRGRRRRAAIHRYVESLQIRPKRVGASIRNLSGGNQQKVVIARWLQSGAKILLFDEPTRGIDVGAKAEIHELLRRLASEGAAILVISSELPELLGVCHRIGVMREGRLQRVLPNGPDLTEERLMAYGVGEEAGP